MQVRLRSVQHLYLTSVGLGWKVGLKSGWGWVMNTVVCISKHQATFLALRVERRSHWMVSDVLTEHSSADGRHDLDGVTWETETR